MHVTHNAPCVRPLGDAETVVHKALQEVHCKAPN